jgi:hypothetical protein
MSLILGANVHLSYTATAYVKQQSAVLDAIDPAKPDSLGFVLLREDSATGVAKLKARFGNAVKVIGVAGNGAVAKAMLDAGVDYLEGPNERWTDTHLKVKVPVSAEYPKGERPYTVAERVDDIVALWNQVYDTREAFQARTGKRIPLLSPSASLGNVKDATAMAKAIGKLAKQPDFQSHHNYSGNRSPAAYLQSLELSKSIADVLAPGKPAILTEFGLWWDDDPAVRSAASHHPTKPDDAIRLYPAYIQAIKDAGFVMAVLYEVVDEAGTDHARRKALQEGRLGQLDLDLSDKPWTPTVRSICRAENGLDAPPSPVVQTPWVVPPAPEVFDQVKLAQAELGVDQDGLIGTQTWAALQNALAERAALRERVRSGIEVLGGTQP